VRTAAPLPDVAGGTAIKQGKRLGSGGCPPWGLRVRGIDIRGRKAHRRRLLGWNGSVWIARGSLGLLLVAAVCCSGTGGKQTGEQLPEERVIALSEGARAGALERKDAYSKEDVQLNEDGTFGGGKRSRFEGQRFVAYGGGVGKASYSKPRYAAGTWDGRETVAKPRFQSPRDTVRFRTASRYEGAVAGVAEQQSRYEGRSASPPRYHAGRAVEHARPDLDKPPDARTRLRREVYPETPIFSQDEYSRMTIEQTRDILGRDD